MDRAYLEQKPLLSLLSVRRRQLLLLLCVLPILLGVESVLETESPRIVDSSTGLRGLQGKKEE